MSDVRRSSLGQRALLVAIGLFAGLAAGEILFRVVPFERVKYEIRYGHFSGNEVSRFLEYDPVLTFRNRRSASFPDAGVEINSLGIRGPEIRDPKPPGVRRVLCLGDSCTFGAMRPYPQILQTMLDERAPGAFEVVNAGVIGYTSLHGLEWFERDLARLQPDVVTLYFGWNDMWREKDSAVRGWFKSRIAGEPQPRLRSYLWDAASRGFVFLANTFGWSALQVPPEQYRAVLERFAALGRAQGFTVLYLTAPSGFDGDHTPQWLIDHGFVARGDSAPALRRTYNHIVTEVAAREKAPLVDCSSDFERSGGRALFEDPDRDPIHPNDTGYRRIAAALGEELLRLKASSAASASR
ncbi:MAG TPA: SGNH/GDSL hydrolase family protein [Candidatus Binatia bacterium]|nr:SGNH/GDSL hydrolase family protein [Candidatus Binatia bacterium]